MRTGNPTLVFRCDPRLTAGRAMIMACLVLMSRGSYALTWQEQVEVAKNWAEEEFRRGQHASGPDFLTVHPKVDDAAIVVGIAQATYMMLRNSKKGDLWEDLAGYFINLAIPPIDPAGREKQFLALLGTLDRVEDDLCRFFYNRTLTSSSWLDRDEIAKTLSKEIVAVGPEAYCAYKVRLALLLRLDVGHKRLKEELLRERICLPLQFTELPPGIGQPLVQRDEHELMMKNQLSEYLEDWQDPCNRWCAYMTISNHNVASGGIRPSFKTLIEKSEDCIVQTLILCGA